MPVHDADAIVHELQQVFAVLLLPAVNPGDPSRKLKRDLRFSIIGAALSHNLYSIFGCSRV